MLLLAQLAVLLLSTCVVFIDAGRTGRAGAFRPVGRRAPVLNPGAHLLWPWPVDQIYRYRTDQIQTFDVGFTPDAQSEADQTILWSVGHTEARSIFSSATARRSRLPMRHRRTRNDRLQRRRRWA